MSAGRFYRDMGNPAKVLSTDEARRARSEATERGTPPELDKTPIWCLYCDNVRKTRSMRWELGLYMCRWCRHEMGFVGVNAILAIK